ncbi:MAG TPA: multidrug effflux MFS transporter [Xanthobacteraceae bacterium]|nr:multidrug effflux MFS transporter [Xanthobacteraceae bacterium]
MLRPDTLALTALLALLTAVGPLSIDLYLPSLPSIGAALGASPSAVGLTISLYLIGFAVGQMVYGPLSDRYGRRPVLLTALAIFCLASLSCAASPSIAALIGARALQATGSAGTIVLARAVVRDLYEGPRAGRELSLMAAIMGLAPIVAPLIGGVLQTAFGWRACFVFIAAAGLVALASAYWLLPETLRPRAHQSAGLVASLTVVARHRVALTFIGVITASYAGLFAYISGAPFVLQDLLGLSPVGFGVSFALASIGYISGTSLAARIVTRVGLERTITWGVVALAGGGVGMVGATALAPGAVAGIVVPMTVYLLGLGLAMPQALAGALQPFPERAGAASSLIGCLQQAVAASTGALVAHAIGASAWPLTIAIALGGCLSFAIWIATQRLRAAAAAKRGSGRPG